jgi:hypothetical protein
MCSLVTSSLVGHTCEDGSGADERHFEFNMAHKHSSGVRGLFDGQRYSTASPGAAMHIA